MTFRQLEAFYWAATCSSFAIAASRVHLTVSSLSKRIAELESSLGQALFDRSGYRAVLTPVGERLLPLATDLLRRAEQVASTVRQVAGLEGGCRIGTGELASISWVPHWVRAIREAHPGLKISVVVDIGEGLTERLEKGDLDVAVIAGRSRRPGLQAAALTRASFVWCAEPELARRVGRLNASAFAGRTLISLPRGSGVTHILDDWLERAGARPEQMLTTNQWGLVASLIGAGEGVGILPKGLAQALESRKRLCILPTRHRLRMLEYGFHFRHDDPRTLVPELHRLCMTCADFDAPGSLAY
ncbi:MAG: LysR family transcriptional regulator [Burkholderiaceae bacterium]